MRLRDLLKTDWNAELEEYFKCEDDVEAALNYLDNHPNCTLEDYEAWLTHRENAIKEIEGNKREDN